MTRADCVRLGEAGLLAVRWELVAGEIVERAGQSLRHGKAVMRVVAWLLQLFGTERVVSQVSIDVAPEDNPTSEPEPDFEFWVVDIEARRIHVFRDASAGGYRSVVVSRLAPTPPG